MERCTERRACKTLLQWRHSLHILPIIATLAFFATFIACSGKYKDPPDLTSSATSVFVYNGDVYVTGRKYDKSQGKNVATVWKNGLPQFLPTQGTGSAGYSVFVSEGDVYVAGIQWIDPRSGSLPPNLGQATLWKNGVGQLIGNNDIMSSALSVFVSDGDVYVAGFFNFYTHWGSVVKNNRVVSDFAPLGALAYSLYVANGDVYVGGHDKGHRAFVWKNGEALYQYGGNEHTNVHSIFVSGEDVYLAGYFGDDSHGCRIIALKNGEPLLGDYSFAEYGSSIFVENGDIFTAGTSGRLGTTATVWGNGIPQHFGNGVASSAWVSDGNVYVAGMSRLPPHTDGVACLWKNGVPQELK
ncbi:MAG: hypothetical protein FWG12_02825 [Holophagaceae bacterium]|nr:hypothetical protein [Holophagaceae bacterium]